MNTQYSEAREIERAYEWLKEYYKKPIHPEYRRVTTLEEAVSLLEQYGADAKIFAGGTDLLGLMKNRVHAPGVLVNIKPIRRIQHIALNQAGLSVGALSLLGEMEKSPLIRQQVPILFEALRSIASPHIRNMATVGGNLCQETRCWYFRRPPDTGISFECRRKKEDGMCYAVNGENQFHAVTGPSPCVSVCPSDLATVLLALDARVKTEDRTGGRTLAVDELYSEFGTALKPAEMISTVLIPRVETESRQRFLKFRRRKAIDFAVVSVAAVVNRDKNGAVRDARIALGGVSQKPLRALEAEQILVGRHLTGELAEKASGAAVRGFRPLSKNGYKVQILKALVRRALVD